MPRQGHNTPLPLERSPPASFKRLLGANAAYLSGPHHSDGGQDCRNQWTQVNEAVRLGANQDDGHPDGGEVLLMGQVLIHGHEHVELSVRSSEQLPVLQTRPTAAAYCPDFVARQLIGKIVRRDSSSRTRTGHQRVSRQF